METLQVPALFQEFYRQPVEKLRMRWSLTLCSEIFRCRNNTCAKVSLPYSIHDRARGSRRAGINQPSRESQPGWWRAGGQPVKERRRTRRDNFAGLEEIAARQDVCLPGSLEGFKH